MSPRKSADLAFVSAVVLLLLFGVGVIVAISRYSDSSQWVMHTYEVQVATASVDKSLTDAARDRLSYITWGDPAFLQQYEQAKNEVYADLARLRPLTQDNSLQRQLFARLQRLADQRIENLRVSLDARIAHQADQALQDSAMNKNTELATATAKVVSDIQAQEHALLETRKSSASLLFMVMVWTFGIMLASAVVLLWVHYRLLGDELGRRVEAENGARRLSAHVLELQDEERRKFSRELHDSLGQNLAVAKMIAFGLSEKHPNENSAMELVDVLNRSIQETRTISHLMHPPLLDELGLASAVSWYVEGFSQRSGLQISLKIAEDMGRLPRPVELVLFRVLQESLTNVHRHAKSAKADVALYLSEGGVALQVRDYGRGISQERLHHFRSNGTQAGVGLTGMRERVREQGGQFEIYSDVTGTEVLVTIPVAPAMDSSEKEEKEEEVTAEQALSDQPEMERSELNSVARNL